jgi:hypothetical protein
MTFGRTNKLNLSFANVAVNVRRLEPRDRALMIMLFTIS